MPAAWPRVPYRTPNPFSEAPGFGGRTVKDNDLGLGNTRTDLASPPVVFMDGGMDEGEEGNKAVVAGAQVHFGSAIWPAVFGPVDKVLPVDSKCTTPVLLAV